jgi:divalent metal cation (Fe/Co/Zn/Cd) transporter
VHVQVDPDLTVNRAHEIGHHVQEAIQHALPHIHSILVHIEPHTTKDEPSP